MGIEGRLSTTTGPEIEKLSAYIKLIIWLGILHPNKKFVGPFFFLKKVSWDVERPEDNSLEYVLRVLDKTVNSTSTMLCEQVALLQSIKTFISICNPNVRYRINNSLLLVPVTKQTNSV